MDFTIENENFHLKFSHSSAIDILRVPCGRNFSTYISRSLTPILIVRFNFKKILGYQIFVGNNN